LDETRAQWAEIERAWRASPLAEIDLIPTVMSLVDEATGEEGPPLDADFAIALAMATDTLLSCENIGEVTPLWNLVESDMAVAMGFRKMLVHRRRWALNPDLLMSIFGRQLVDGYRDLIAALPDGCFDQAEGEDALFTVPLSSLLENPAEAIENLILSVYDDQVFKYGLFEELRARYSLNIVVASGFPPDTNPHDVPGRLVMPTAHKRADAASLVDLYLAGTPLEDVLNVPVPFGVPEHIRFEHCHIVGGTGHGKTQLMQRMIHADLVAAKEDSRSVVVIDSQGDLIQKLLRLDLFAPDRPGSLADRLVLIDPADVDFPASLNLFDAHLDRVRSYSAVDQERVFNGVVELYETFFGALLGAELTQKQGVIFRYLARLLLAIPGATIHTLMQLMEDGKPFKLHMEQLDGSARYFFETEFFHPSFAATKKQILKRLWGVLSTPAFERMFAQPDSKLDMFEALNEGKIILISTAKDLLKTEGSALFGRFFIAMIAQAALERSTIPEQERTPTFVYVDEAQEYFDDTIETILGQARKYRVGFTAAHQTLDQLSPRLRSAFLSNTSFKCAGGVSNKDARALAGELHTSPDFIEGARRRRDRTEFAVWVKHRTPQALCLTVPLGFLERQPTLTEEELDALMARNRAMYCGTRASLLQLRSPEPERQAPRGSVEAPPPEQSPVRPERTQPAAESAAQTTPIPPADIERPRMAEAAPRELGKGGPKHRYLQALVKELGEQRGFRATIEAPVPGGVPGQVDVLLERDGLTVAVEISVSTPVEQERENVRKCLNAGVGHVALVLAKSRATQGRYRTTILEALAPEEHGRLTFLAPEDVSDYIAALALPPAPSDEIVKGYRVRLSHASVSPAEAADRRERLAKIVARSLKDAG
jgi:hypothetical protein